MVQRKAQQKKRLAPEAPVADRAALIYQKLSEQHPDATCELHYRNPLELMIATILSAQCTDVRVNMVTKVLFRKCRTAKDYDEIPLSELEEIIHSTGFFRQKAKSIKGAARILLEKHRGKVPSSMEELVVLPGVGRKTANVILGNAFEIPGLPVDTHVSRIVRRIGLTQAEDPVRIEAELCEMLEPKNWTMFSHVVIFHGRRVCKARKPDCSQCSVQELCEFYLELGDE